MAQVRLQGVSKDYGDATVLFPTDLTIGNGEFLTLLGPSGCGKTTTLRLVAGFMQPTRGRVFIGDTDVTDLPPQKREIGMVFQDYALFPHLTIAENIAFGLVERKVKREIIDRRVGELLNLIRLPGAGNRYPAEVSGGQQQRIAVARAVAHPPRVLLMDEPLGALDLKLREALQIELRQIQQALRITTVYVTHDQTEAMTMSDRIIVMSAGRIEQSGTALDIYHRPATRFAAEFVGKINLIEGRPTARDGRFLAVAAGARSFRALDDGPVGEGRAAWLAIRPECVAFAREPAAGMNTLGGTVKAKIFAGNLWQVVVGVETGPDWTVETRDEAESVAVGDAVTMSWRPERTVVLRS